MHIICQIKGSTRAIRCAKLEMGLVYRGNLFIAFCVGKLNEKEMILMLSLSGGA